VNSKVDSGIHWSPPLNHLPRTEFRGSHLFHTTEVSVLIRPEAAARRNDSKSRSILSA